MKTTEIDILNTIVENTDMAMHSFDVLKDTKHARDADFKEALERQYAEYREINSEAANLIRESGNEVKTRGSMAKTMSKIGIKMNTLMDGSVSHMADMIIQGSTMGITSITKELNEKSGNLDKPVAELADKLLHTEQKNIDTMRTYL